MTIAGIAATPSGSDPLEPAKSRERTPWLLGLVCLLTSLLPSYVVLAGPLKSNGSPAKMMAVALFGLTVLGFFLVKRTTSKRVFRPGVAIILVYLFLQLAVYGIGMAHGGSLAVEASKTRAVISLIESVGIALYVITRAQTIRQRNFALGCLAVGLAFASLVALLQQFTNVDLRYLFQPPGFVINTDIGDLADRQGAKRVVGTSTHAIEFSVLAAIAIPLTIHFARYAVHRQVRLLSTLACISALVALPAAVSRTGLLALAAALAIYVWSFKVREVAVAVAGACLGVAVYIAFSPSTANALWATIVGSEHDESILGRTADYAVVSATFRANPMFGLGLGASPPSDYSTLDNEWLQSIVQGGIVGLTALIVLTAGGIFGISAALRRATTRRERDQAYALGSMFVAILVASFTFDLLSFAQTARILFLTFGLLWCTFAVRWPEPLRSPST